MIVQRKMVKKALSLFKEKRIKDFFRITVSYIYPLKANSFKICKGLVKNKSGLEIGGPSSLFSGKGLLPVYSHVKSLDNCNFSSQTIWEGRIKEGYNFKYDENKSYGYQYILDTNEMARIETAKYDFVLSSHVIEHFANPIKALFEWVRVLKEKGVVVIIFPHKDGTFDHKRDITVLSHIIEDYNKNTSEDDLTHLEEILELHDLARDTKAGTFSQFKERSRNNFANRGLHHHVFNTLLAVKLIDFIKLEILSVEAVLPLHIIIIAKKSDNYNNQDMIDKLESNKFSSPFKSDKFL